MDAPETFAFSLSTIFGLTMFAPLERLKLIMQTKSLNTPDVAKNFHTYKNAITSKGGKEVGTEGERKEGRNGGREGGRE